MPESPNKSHLLRLALSAVAALSAACSEPASDGPGDSPAGSACPPAVNKLGTAESGFKNHPRYTNITWTADYRFEDGRLTSFDGRECLPMGDEAPLPESYTGTGGTACPAVFECEGCRLYLRWVSSNGQPDGIGGEFMLEGAVNAWTGDSISDEDWANAPAEYECPQYARYQSWTTSACVPDCSSAQCGEADGCGGTCTGCPGGQTCRSGSCQVDDSCPTGCRPTGLSLCCGPPFCAGECVGTPCCG